jgi:hypothetical protein
VKAVSLLVPMNTVFLTESLNIVVVILRRFSDEDKEIPEEGRL